MSYSVSESLCEYDLYVMARSKGKKKKFTAIDTTRVRGKTDDIGQLTATCATGRKFVDLEQRQDEATGSDSDPDWETETETEDVADTGTGSACPTGYRLVEMKQLQDLVSGIAVCRHCGDNLRLEEDSNRRRGWASFIKLRCSNADCEGPSAGKWTSKRVGTGGGREINKLSALAMRSIGKGRRGAATFASHLNMPPPIHNNSWNRHTKAWGDSAHDMLQDDFDR